MRDSHIQMTEEIMKEKQQVKFLKQERYPVHDIQMGSWYTSVYLCGFDIEFNSIFFDFEGQNGEPCNIYIDPKYNPHVRRQENAESED